MAEDGVKIRLTRNEIKALSDHLQTGRKAQRFAVDMTRKLALDVVGQIVRVAPVDTGRMRAAFFPLYARPWAGSRPPFRGRSGAAVLEGLGLGEARETIGQRSLRISVVNSVFYTRFVEERTGFIARSFKLEVARFRRELQSALDELVAGAKRRPVR